MTIRKKPKLLVLTSTFSRGINDGSPSFVFELCRRLTDSFDIHVVMPHSAGAKREEEIAGIHITRFRYSFTKYQQLIGTSGILPSLSLHPWRYLLIPFFILGQLTTALRLLKKHDYCAIHAHWLIPQGFVAVVARLLLRSSVPVVCTSHGSDIFALKGGIFDAVRRFVLTRTDIVTFVSHALREKALSSLGHFPKTEIIPMGVALEHEFVPSDAPRQNGQILFVGRLIQEKGVQYLIRALPELIRIHPDISLIIVGTGPYETALQEEATALKVDHCVTFLGPLKHGALPELYQFSTVFVLPSLSEGFGLVLVEAMGCECPVIATDLPAIRDIVKDGKTGLLFRPKSATDLADKITYLLDNDEIRHDLGHSGRNYVCGRYDWKIIADRYALLIEGLDVSSHHDVSSNNS
ncbi:MAG TPA: glycosyltransferase family 4 protein [Deltaproteobacteria bacterium]|nr:glycosyltransferase family 4 protein [Deltaproteobacteria bacterium]